LLDNTELIDSIHQFLDGSEVITRSNAFERLGMKTNPGLSPYSEIEFMEGHFYQLDRNHLKNIDTLILSSILSFE
jgi:hypothetical protein